MAGTNLWQVYGQLVGLAALGWGLEQFSRGKSAPIWLRSLPNGLGKFLFWVGVPVSNVAFLHRVNLSASLWLAPVVGWLAILLGLGLALVYWRWLLMARSRLPKSQQWEGHYLPATQGSFLLASMVGNTGYIGYPVTLAMFGREHFPWAIFFDLGSTLGAYGLGVALAAHFGVKQQRSLWEEVIKNPALWGMVAGLSLRDLPLLNSVESSLWFFGWVTISLALVLVGMRLSQATTFSSLALALVALVIKMMLVPLVMGFLLLAIDIPGSIHHVLLMQIAMPPAFATLVIAEAYGLDKNLSVTSLSVGSLLLLIMLPVWLWLFD
jgi:hypothetical protein